MINDDAYQPWQKSVPAKVVAVGFSLFIVAGNIWLALALVGAPIRTWVGVSFALALAVVAAGGVALGWRQLTHLLATNTKVNGLFKSLSKNAR